MPVPAVEIASLLPHQPPMRWIDALVDCTDVTATASVRLNAEHFALHSGQLLEGALIECVAQTVAAAEAFRAHHRGSALPKGGMLTSVSNFRIRTRPKAGETLHIRVEELRRFGPMLMVRGEITSDRQPVASGEISVYA
jgi:predicted hotdog family 3-hydroxylacyl-ACP dehydratase